MVSGFWILVAKGDHCLSVLGEDEHVGAGLLPLGRQNGCGQAVLGGDRIHVDLKPGGPEFFRIKRLHFLTPSEVEKLWVLAMPFIVSLLKPVSFGRSSWISRNPSGKGTGLRTPRDHCFPVGTFDGHLSAAARLRHVNRGSFVIRFLDADLALSQVVEQQDSANACQGRRCSGNLMPAMARTDKPFFDSCNGGRARKGKQRR